MPLLTIDVTYKNNTILYAADLNNAFGSIATLVNTTLLDSTNIQEASLSTANLASVTIGTTQIANGSITSSCIDNNAIGAAQMAALNSKLSASTNILPITSGYPGTLIGQVTLITTGRPVCIYMQDDGTQTSGSGSGSYIDCSSISYFLVLRDGIQIGAFLINTSQASPPTLSLMDSGALAGSHVYAIYGENFAGLGDLFIQYATVGAYELP
jgi:hypothetical protein